MRSAPQDWSTLLELLGALASRQREDSRHTVIAAGLGREPVGVLLHAGDVDPKPLTAADLLACVPYYAEASFAAPMQRLAAGGWLEPAGTVVSVGAIAYRLTE